MGAGDSSGKRWRESWNVQEIVEDQRQLVEGSQVHLERINALHVAFDAAVGRRGTLHENYVPAGTAGLGRANGLAGRGRGATQGNSRRRTQDGSSNGHPDLRIRRFFRGGGGGPITTRGHHDTERADATTANSAPKPGKSFQLKLAAQGTETARHVAALTSPSLW